MHEGLSAEQPSVERAPRVRFSAVALAAPAGLLVLILARLLFLHGDASDFPIDRNTNAGITIARVMNDGSVNLTGMPVEQIFAPSREAPEFPFMALGAWVVSRLGFSGVVSGRIVSLAAALLTGIGLLILGRRLRPSWIGCAALWLYALLPISVWMGRSLLPDSLMVAGTVWAIIAAGAGLPAGVFAHGPQNTGRAQLRRAIGVALLLSLAAVIKLPAVLFAPVVALILLVALGWRRPLSWAQLALTTAITYGFVCLWYRLGPINPFPALRRISRSTNNLFEGINDLFSLVMAEIVLQRSILVLTLPGVVFVVLGWVMLQRRAGDRLWLNAWFFAALASLALTIKANTYWAYVLVPPGCLVIAVGLAELRTHGRAVLLACVPVVGGLLLICPGVRTAAGYLALNPSYAGMRELGKERLLGSHVLYSGNSEQDLQYFTGVYGLGLRMPTARMLTQQALNSGFKYFMTNRMDGAGPPLMTLFVQRPIVATRGYDFALLEVGKGQTIGRDALLPEEAQIAPLELAGRLRVTAMQANPPHLRAGEATTISLTFERGPDYAAPAFLAMRWEHANMHEAFPLSPTNHGASLIQWQQPVFQTPDFEQGDVQTVDYQFVVPKYFPAGDFGLRLAIFAQERSARTLGKDAVTTPVLTIEPPAETVQLPVSIDFDQILWTSPRWRNGPGWLGRVNRSPILSSAGTMWINPGLPPGEYELVIKAAADPLGQLDRDRWPILKLDRPGGAFQSEMRFTRRGMRTQRLRLRWYGEKDCLKLSIANPMFDYARRPIMRLSPEEYALDNRCLTIDSIRFEAVKD